jgi:formate dehydrogenase
MPGATQKNLKVVAVLPEAGKASKNPDYVCCVERALNLRDFLKERGCEIVATSDKEGENSELEKHLKDMDILITTPFHPAYMTADRLKRAEKLKLILTAGVGSDHVDLHAAADKKITVAEVSGSNVTSVAEDEVMRMLVLIRNFVPAYQQIINDDWNVAEVAVKSWDIKDKTIGTIGGGRIGFEVVKRLQNWDVKCIYHARHDKPNMNKYAQLIEDEEEFLKQCDIVTINVPLTDATRGYFNKEKINKMKKGAFLVNNARGAIVNADDVKEALESGQLSGYSGDVWPQQPAAKDHPWRHMPNHAMTAHTSGTTLDAQKRYQEGIQTMLDQWLNEKPFEEDNYIVREGELASQYT